MVPQNSSEMKLPPMRMIRQRYKVAPKVDVSAEVNRQWDRIKDNLNLPTGSSVAIGVGNQIGAEHYHRLSVVRNMYEIISSAGKELLNRAIVHFFLPKYESRRPFL